MITARTKKGLAPVEDAVKMSIKDFHANSENLKTLVIVDYDDESNVYVVPLSSRQWANAEFLPD